MEFKIINNGDNTDTIIAATEIRNVGCVVTTSSPKGEAICFVPGVELLLSNKEWGLVKA